MPSHFMPLLLAAGWAGNLLAATLWAGFAGLTVALVVVMRTRWGQARPLSKCLALSIYAHVLLMTYAYGTKLMTPAPPGGGDGGIVPLFLAASEGGDDPASDGQEELVAPWSQPTTESSPMISLAEPARQELPTPEASEPPPVTLPQDVPPPMATNLVETPPRELETATEPAAPTPIENPAAPLTEASEPPPTIVEGPQRLNTDDSVRESPSPPVAPPAADARVQELVERRLTGDLVDVAPAERGAPVAQNGGALEVAKLTPDALRQQLATRSPRRLADGAALPDLYRLRMAGDRHRLARGLGATTESDQAVARALRWLVANQSEDGRWSAKQFGAGVERKVLGQDRQGTGPDADTGITALAVLALLGAGHTHLEGDYREAVQKALEYLLREQKANGSLAGDAKLFATMYCHGMATIAISEAFAMTGDKRLESAVRKASDFTIKAQHSTTGGWRYLPGDPGDMSQFGWQVLALKSASMTGTTIPDRTRAGMLRFLQNNTSGKAKGLGSYRTGERPSRTMTAEALACRLFLEQSCSDELIDEAAKFVLEESPQPGKPDFYYWYYGSLAMFQLQDEHWQKWNEGLQRELVGRQLGEGDLAGSYETDEVWSGYGGRVYTTSMAALCLEVYYRYLPVYRVTATARR